MIFRYVTFTALSKFIISNYWFGHRNLEPAFAKATAGKAWNFEPGTWNLIFLNGTSSL